MNVYIYRAALYCEDCALRLARGLARPAHEPWDSDEYPNGPYSCGGGEADSPQHCDSCGVFLENPLTPDGVEYVRELAETAVGKEGDGKSWSEYADIVRSSEPTLSQWIEFYFAPGM